MLLRMRGESVVPLTMEGVTGNGKAREVCIADPHSRRIGPRVERRFHLQAAASGGRTDQFDNYFVTDQRLPAPVAADVGEEPVLDLYLHPLRKNPCRARGLTS